MSLHIVCTCGLTNNGIELLLVYTKHPTRKLTVWYHICITKLVERTPTSLGEIRQRIIHAPLKNGSSLWHSKWKHRTVVVLLLCFGLTEILHARDF